MRFKTIMAGGSLVVAAGMLTATPASADDIGPSGCAYNNICIWQNAHYGGSGWAFVNANSNWNNQVYDVHRLNDEDSSSDNQWPTYPSARIYKNSGYGGGVTICLNRWAHKSHHYAAGDQGSSHKAVNAAC